MYRGKDLWKDIVPFDLTSFRINSLKTIEIYPDTPADLYDALMSTANRLPNKIAIVADNGVSVSFRELLAKVDAASCYLSGLGVRQGSHVALMLYNSLEFSVAFLALVRIGAVSIPLPTKYKQPEILSLMEKADVDMVISDPDFTDWFSLFQASAVILEIDSSSQEYGFPDVPADHLFPEYSYEAKADTDVLLVFTSGTTSRSKGVLLKNYNVMHAIRSYQITLGITEEDSAVIPIPIYLITGLIAVFGLFIYTGGTVYLQKFFRAEQVLDCVRDRHITFLHASPTVFSMLLAKSSDYPSLPSLRMFACGSSNMPKEKIRKLHRWLPESEFRTVYGLTETTSPATVFPVDAATSPCIGSSGLPIPGLEFRILLENGEEADDGTEGEIWVKGTNILEAYYKMDSPLIRDGWLDTGDLGYFNSDGYLFICDRRKDMINRGGEKITSFDVENEIYQIPGVDDAAVVGIPDPTYGEIPVAAVTALPGHVLNPDEMKAILKTRLAKYKVPTTIRILSEMPVTPNGKIDKKYIRTLFYPGS